MFPLRTNIPLDELNKRIDETFPETIICVRTRNRLQDRGIVRNWQLLVQNEASFLQTRHLKRKSLEEVNAALKDKGWKFGRFFPDCEPLFERIWSDKRRNGISCFEAIGSDGALFAQAYPEVAPFLALHGLHANMTIDELFVYVPTERPPLTEAQVMFLGMRTTDVFAREESTWCNPLRGSDRHQIVIDIALVLPHLRADDEHKAVIARIRAYIEAEVGPLPLALSSEELRNFFR